jgi:VCBS repeat-containing protein
VNLKSGARHGIITMVAGPGTANGAGTFVYMPDPGYNGPDEFTYTVSDGLLQSVGTVRLNVETPLADDDDYPILHPYASSGDERFTYFHALAVEASRGLLANDTDADGDPLIAERATKPSHGELTLYPNGSFSYLPQIDPNQKSVSLTDSFSYVATDGISDSNVATATIHFQDEAPVVNPVSYTIAHDSVLSVPAENGLLTDPNDPNGDALIVAHSSLLGAYSDGSIYWQPPPGAVGTFHFDYTVTDGVLDSTAPLTINVVENAPVANGDFYGAMGESW